MIKPVAEARETLRHLTRGHPPKPVHPVVARAARKAARQKISDSIKIS
jgi:hypothetical protein